MLFKEITASINGSYRPPYAVGNDPTNWDCRPAGVNNPRTPGCGAIFGTDHCIVPVPVPEPIGIECVRERKP